jgi:iron complex transport system substrate-binding protein
VPGRRQLTTIGRVLLIPVLGAAVLAGCGSSDDSGNASPAAGTDATTTTTTAGGQEEASPVLPVTVPGFGGDVTVESAERIIPVDGDLAEIVFALGLGDKVVATDLSATYPQEAADRPEIGYQRALAAEPIISFSPTVVLATDLAGPREVLEQLAAVVPTVLVDAPDDLTGPAAKIRAVAAALGVPGRGEALAQQTQAEIDAAVAAVPADQPQLKVAALYVRGERIQQLFGPGSGTHALLDATGVTDVGETLGVDDNQAVTAESFIAAAPDVLVVTTTGLESVGGIDGLLAIPAYTRTPAAQQRRVLAYEDQYLLGFGPRTGQLLTELVHDIYETP